MAAHNTGRGYHWSLSFTTDDRISGKLGRMAEQASWSPCRLPEGAKQICTPLKVEAWEEMLQLHPDRGLVRVLLRGIQEGFRVGFRHNQVELKPCGRNLVSAREHPEVVCGYLQEEVSSGRVIDVGDSKTAESLGMHCSPFGVIPKTGRPGRWRLIVDLSSPEQSSVNDGISKELSSLSYLSVDDVIAEVVRRGRGTLMAKMDIKKAYRNVPVHPVDRLLLGMQWRGRVYVDGCLPFGLRSATLLFTAVADALQWVMEARGVAWLGHYIDDFITVGAPQADECRANLGIMNAVCMEAGMPTEQEKEEGPTTVLTFLGIELDSEAMVICLPAGKLHQLQESLRSWRGMKACRKSDLLSIIGVMSHACKAVRAGRSFLRRLIDLSMTVNHLNRHVRLNVEARADIEWWHQFCQEWNGVEMLTVINRVRPVVVVTSDASGSWGCGAMCGSQWFQLPWERLGNTARYGITAKELLPIVVAAAIWGREWRSQTVLARCDNMAVVAIVNSGSCREREAMHLRRCLAFLEAKGAFHIYAEHIKGVNNGIADALSRNQLTRAKLLFPQADEAPTSIPEAVLEALVDRKQDAASPNWTRLWQTISPRV